MDKKDFFLRKVYNHRYNILIFFVITLVFVVLYEDYIFGDSTYIFSDVGSDTLFQFYPKRVFISDKLRQGSFAEYSLQYGLGKSIDRIWTQYFNPFDVVCVFCTENTMGAGLLLSTYLKCLAIAYFSFFFLKKIVLSDKASFFGCILWTYCSFAVIWGQHYHFLTAFALTTISMNYLQGFLLKNKYAVSFLIVSLSLLLINSYYFFWMTGLFFAFYVVGYCFINKINIKNSFIYLFKLAGMAVLSVGIAAFSFLPDFYDFMKSARTVSVKTLMFSFYDMRTIIDVLGNFISPNIFGINEYYGISNFYESAKIFVGSLFIFSIIYHFIRKKWNIVLTFVISTFSLFCIETSNILTGIPGCFRWTYILCILITIEITVFLRDFFEERVDVKSLKNSFLITPIVYIILIMCFEKAIRVYDVKINNKDLGMSMLFVGLYSIVLLACIKKKEVEKNGIVILMGLFLAEIICMNYPSINNRGIVKESALKSELYNNKEDRAALDTIARNNNGLYRVNKTNPVFLNDAYIQGFNGMSCYDSVNSENLVEFCKKNDIPAYSPFSNYISIPYQETIYNSLLSCKYVVGNVDVGQYSTYEKTNEVNIFINKWSLPFGYVYSQNIKVGDYMKLPKENKGAVLTNAFYFTNEKDEEAYGKTMEITDLSNDIQRNIEKLQSMGVSDAKIDGHDYTASIYSEDDGMLCIPIIYDDNWEIEIDGQAEYIYNINGGLIGAKVSRGSHKIKMIYNTKLFDISSVISICSVLLFILGCLLKGTGVLKKYR